MRDAIEQFSNRCIEWHEASTFAGSVRAAQQLSNVLFGEIVPGMRDNHDARVERADALWPNTAAVNRAIAARSSAAS